MVLIAYDGSATASAAVQVAGRIFPGHEAVVLTVFGPVVSMDGMPRAARVAVPDEVIREGAARLRQEAEREATAVAEAGAALAVSAGLDGCAATQVRTGSAWSAVLGYAREWEAELVVCGARGQGALARIALGSTSSGLVNHADRPVLVVPDGESQLTGPVALAYDGSEGADASVVAAARLFPGGRAVIVHAWEAPLADTLAGASLHRLPSEELRGIVADVEAFFAERGRETAQTGATLAREHGLDARELAVEAHDAIWRAVAAAAAEEDAALILVGSRGRGAATGALLGSVSVALVHGAERPVMVVPPAA